MRFSRVETEVPKVVLDLSQDAAAECSMSLLQHLTQAEPLFASFLLPDKARLCRTTFREIEATARSQ